MSSGWPIDPRTGEPFDQDALRSFARLTIEREARERVITEGSTRRFLLCTASFNHY